MKVIKLLNLFSYLIPVIIKRKVAFSNIFFKFNTIRQGPTRFKYICWTMASRLGLLLTLHVWVITCLDGKCGVSFFLYTFSKQQWNSSYPKNSCVIILRHISKGLLLCHLRFLRFPRFLHFEVQTSVHLLLLSSNCWCHFIFETYCFA